MVTVLFELFSRCCPRLVSEGAMGVTVSTSLAKIKENPLLLRFVGSEKVAEGDGFWKELLTFTAAHPASQ